MIATLIKMNFINNIRYEREWHFMWDYIIW